MKSLIIGLFLFITIIANTKDYNPLTPSFHPYCHPFWYPDGERQDTYTHCHYLPVLFFDNEEPETP